MLQHTGETQQTSCPYCSLSLDNVVYWEHLEEHLGTNPATKTPPKPERPADTEPADEAEAVNPTVKDIPWEEDEEDIEGANKDEKSNRKEENEPTNKPSDHREDARPNNTLVRKKGGGGGDVGEAEWGEFLKKKTESNKKKAQIRKKAVEQEKAEIKERNHIYKEGRQQVKFEEKNVRQQWSGKSFTDPGVKLLMSN